MTLGPFSDLILIKLSVPMLIRLRAQVGLRHIKVVEILDNLEKYSETKYSESEFPTEKINFIILPVLNSLSYNR